VTGVIAVSLFPIRRERRFPNGRPDTRSHLGRHGDAAACWQYQLRSRSPKARARTVRDLAKLLDGMVGYDPEDPVSALGVRRVEGSYTRYPDQDGLNGARIGILRESMGNRSARIPWTSRPSMLRSRRMLPN